MAASRPCFPLEVTVTPPAFVRGLHVPIGLRGCCEGTARGSKLIMNEVGLTNIHAKMNSDKLRQKALTGIHWYDFVGTDYAFENFQQRVAEFDRVASEYSDMYFLYIVDNDNPAGEVHSKFYYHKQLCQDILRSYQIFVDVPTFVFESSRLTYERGSSQRKALTELYERYLHPLGADTSTEAASPDEGIDPEHDHPGRSTTTPVEALRPLSSTMTPTVAR